ncbi:TerB family tellurite resistance protein [Microbispora sp. NEAU-D428]|uniref:TerB family tellurite resistance protein n=1 Tax=Microbispora sitophila TaxID=2771537 RepID=UPI0018667EF8|nr:TerB family tellurite resistance protein [Microbispora sitophila]MBE3016060.1 TerB family tellurite resistance protein [Microbispora sitophila]
MAQQAETAEEFGEKTIMVHAMMLMCYIDQKMAPQELATIESYAKALPEFYGRNFQDYYEAAKRLASRADGSIDCAVGALSDIKSEILRRRTYYCALELAFADGLVEAEEKLLVTVREALGIPPELADDMRRVIGMKFSV